MYISTTSPTNPFSLFTGLTGVYKDFTVALPSTLTRTNVMDINTNANITNSYILNSGFPGIANYAGITSAYNVYIMSPSIPYTDDIHQHSITRA